MATARVRVPRFPPETPGPDAAVGVAWRGSWRTVQRTVRQLNGPPGRRRGEITWRGFPYPVRELGPGRWRVELYGAPTAVTARVRVPSRQEGRPFRRASLRFIPRVAQPGARRRPQLTVGFALYQGTLYRVRRGESGGLELWRRL
jgi:hypothetical protein